MPPRLGVERFFQLALLGLVASGFLAVAGSGRLDWPTTLLTAVALLARAAMSAGLVRFEIPDRWATAAALAYIGVYPIDLQFLSREFLPATVHLVFFLAVLKILTAKTHRDHLYTAAISLVQLLAGALLSAELNFFFFVGLYLLFAVAALASGEIRRAAERSGQVARVTARRRVGGPLTALTVTVTALVLALATGLFFTLPRTATAALRHLAARGLVLPGFSNEVTLGQIGELKQKTNAVMHVRFYGKGGSRPARWRGAALADFDGRRWFNGSNRGESVALEPAGTTILVDNEQRRRRGDRLTYRVDLKPLATDHLFFAGLPEVITVRGTRLLHGEDGSYRLPEGALDGVRYDVHSFVEPEPTLDAVRRTPIPEAIAERYLRLPGADPRVIALAREMAAGLDDAPLQQARAIERRLRTGYAYTLELPKEKAADPVANFLLERRQGHCEYFASAMAVLLRVVGIPSRLVTGFLGGTYNPVSEQYVVRLSDAHSWVEAWIPGRGWTVFDPTPPDATLRTEGILTRLGLYLDAADTFWQEWVLNYDLGRQVVLAERVDQVTRRLGGDWLSGSQLAWQRWDTAARDWGRRYGAAVAGGAAAALALWWWGPPLWRRVRLRQRVKLLKQGQGSAADATLLYERFLDVLRKRGYSKPAWYTPGEYCAAVKAAPASLGVEAAALAERFTRTYEQLRFGGKVEVAPRLSEMLEELEGLTARRSGTRP